MCCFSLSDALLHCVNCKGIVLHRKVRPSLALLPANGKQEFIVIFAVQPEHKEPDFAVASLPARKASRDFSDDKAFKPPSSLCFIHWGYGCGRLGDSCICTLDYLVLN